MADPIYIQNHIYQSAAKETSAMLTIPSIPENGEGTQRCLYIVTAHDGYGATTITWDADSSVTHTELGISVDAHTDHSFLINISRQAVGGYMEMHIETDLGSVLSDGPMHGVFGDNVGAGPGGRQNPDGEGHRQLR